jgi:all-trans-8'-apo-beta-carotenal 15,15'-oxygenase
MISLETSTLTCYIRSGLQRTSHKNKKKIASADMISLVVLLFVLAAVANQLAHGFRLLAARQRSRQVLGRRHSTMSQEYSVPVTLTNATTTNNNNIGTRTTRTTIPWLLDTATYGEFNQHRDWGFAYSSVGPEACSSYVLDDVEGGIPPDLQGTYYKIGPGNFEREGRRYEHVLDGDGFVAAFHFFQGNNGTAVRYTGRFVETEYFLKERAQDTIQYRNTFGTQRRGGMLANAFDLVLKNVANTNILRWGPKGAERLFALYEAGRPYEMDPDTLETFLRPTDDGPFDGLGGEICNLRGITIDQGGPIDRLIKVGRSFTAHPHILDEDTLVAFTSCTSVRSKEAILEFVEYDKNWQKKNTVEFAFPRGPPPHDFAVSDNYYAFFENPFAEMDNPPYLLGMKAPAQIMQLCLRQPTILNLVPRVPGKKPLKFEVPPYFNIHMVPKAEERDGKLYLYSNGWNLRDERFFAQSENSVPFLGAWGGPYPDFVAGVVPPSLLYRTVIDLQSETSIPSHEEVCPGSVIEFLSQDERETHNVYCSIATTDYTSMPGTGFCQYNMVTSTTRHWWAENRIFTGEILPVPKRNGEPGSWLLAVLYDAEKRRSSLAILDSEKLEEGPVCRLHLKHHLSYGLHGSFCAA